MDQSIENDKRVKPIRFENLTITQLINDIEENKAIDGIDDYFTKVIKGTYGNISYSSTTNFMRVCTKSNNIEIFEFVLDYVNMNNPDIHDKGISQYTIFMEVCLTNNDDIFYTYFDFLKNYNKNLLFKLEYIDTPSELVLLLTKNYKRVYNYLKYIINEHHDYLFQIEYTTNLIIVDLLIHIRKSYNDQRLASEDIKYLQKIEKLIYYFIKNQNERINIINNIIEVHSGDIDERFINKLKDILNNSDIKSAIN